MTNAPSVLPPAAVRDVSPFDRLLGLELLRCDESLVTARVRVRPELAQPIGMVHGGVYAAIAEAVASLGTNRLVSHDGSMGLGQSNSCSFLRPIIDGAIHATARLLHGGASSHVWDVEMRDDDERRCAIARVTIAVRSYTVISAMSR